MRRREFLVSGAAVAAGLAIPRAAWALAANDGWRTFEVTTRAEVTGDGPVRIWLPTALLVNTPYQRTLSNEVEAEGVKGRIIKTQTDGLGFAFAEFPAGTRAKLTLTTRVATRDVAMDLAHPQPMHHPRREELEHDLRSTQLLPTDGIVKATAEGITRGATTDLEKARLLYEWIVENTYRNPKTRGCGTGDIRWLLESRDLGGKCADLNSLFVGMARSVGLPARDVFGIRVAKSELGYKSLGASSEKISKAQHCRSEVYLNDFGWVPVDAADVRKVALEEPPGNRPLDDDMVNRARKRLFCSWEMNWMAYNFAHDVELPGSKGKPVGFFMYPQAESAAGRSDSLDPDAFHYEILSRELKAGDV